MSFPREQTVALNRLAPILAFCSVISLTAAELAVRPPADAGSTRFAVIGDTGTGDKYQNDVAQILVKSREVFPYGFVIMMGDNLYGSERPQDYANKFEKPYQRLLDADVTAHATLGNHDDPNQRLYKPFNMNGERYYTFSKGPIRFFVLDSNYMDVAQVAWLERELQNATEPWKMAYFHHPLYSSGERHGSEVDLRQQLEPRFLKYGVDVVFAGHEHFYERIKPQKGIHYFTCGGAAKLREGDVNRGPLTAAAFDLDRSFMLVEVAGDVFRFQTISRTGARVDEGTITRGPEPKRPSPAHPPSAN
jgi:predicted phosphodiesterase